MARDQDDVQEPETRICLNRTVRMDYREIEAFGEEINKREVRVIVQRIEGTQAQRSLGMLDSLVITFSKSIEQGAETESERRIAVHLQRAVKCVERKFVFVCDIGMNKGCNAQG